MGALAWVVMGLALWHFSIWFPDRFVGGIVGALIGAEIGAFLSGFLIAGAHVPGRHDTHLVTTVEAIPGAVIGMVIVWLLGARRERQQPATAV